MSPLEILDFLVAFLLATRKRMTSSNEETSRACSFPDVAESENRRREIRFSIGCPINSTSAY